MSSKQAHLLHRLFQANIFIGIGVFLAMVYFIATGDYADIQARKETEAVLNAFAIGGLIYSCFFWMVDLFSRPVLDERETA
ncbi:MAG TPA: hypothetical protein VK971_12375 [Thiohalobacter sp.]|nr:hypothetical protein [Thiohalobacter sp.]